MDPCAPVQEPVSPPQEAEQVLVESDDAEDACSPTLAAKDGAEPPCKASKDLPSSTPASSSHPPTKGKMLAAEGKCGSNTGTSVSPKDQAAEQQGLGAPLPAHSDTELNEAEEEEVFDTEDDASDDADDSDGVEQEQHSASTVRMSSPELLHWLVMHSKTSQTFELRFVMHQRRVTRAEEARRVVQANLQRRLESASSEPALPATDASFPADADAESVASGEADTASSAGSSDLAFEIFRELLVSSGEASGAEENGDNDDDDNDNASTHVVVDHADHVEASESSSGSSGNGDVAGITATSAARHASPGVGNSSGASSDSDASEVVNILDGVHAGSDMIDSRAHAQMAEEDRQRRLQDVADMEQQGRVRHVLMGQRRAALEALFGSPSSTASTSSTSAAVGGGGRVSGAAEAASRAHGQTAAYTGQQRARTEQGQQAEAFTSRDEGPQNSNNSSNPELAELQGRGVVSRMLNRRFFITNVNASLATAAHSLGPQRYDVWRQIQHAVRHRRQGTGDDALNHSGSRDAHEGSDPAQVVPPPASSPPQQRQHQQQQNQPRGFAAHNAGASHGADAGVRPPIAPQRNVRLVDPHVRAPTHRPGARNPEMSGELSQLLASHLVQNVLHGNFRTVLELHLQNVVTRRRGGAQQQQRQPQQQRFRRQQPRARAGAPGHAQSQAQAQPQEDRSFPSPPPAAAAGPNTAVLARRVDELTRQMADLVALVQTTYQSQLSMERSLRQEVAAALHGNAPQTQPPSQPATGNRCVICLQAQADTVMYRCGHLCACNACGVKILEDNLPCPCCRAPVTDVLRAYTA